MNTRRGGRATVAIAPSSGAVGIQGLWNCKYGTCPVCGARIAGRRAAELAEAIAVQEANGDSVAFLTLTEQHILDDAPAELYRDLSKAHSAMWAGRPGMRLRREIDGFVRVFEMTHSFGNGYHPHYHEVLFLPGKWTQEQAEDLGRRLHARFRAKLQKLGRESLPDSGGLDVQLVRLHEEVPPQLADYLGKAVYVESDDMDEVRELVSNGSKLAMEAAYGAYKTGRRNKLNRSKGRGQFEVLEDVLVARLAGLGDTPEARRDLALWHEIEQFYAECRPRVWKWSEAREDVPKLGDVIRAKAKALGMALRSLVHDEDRSDEEVADEEDGSLVPVFDVSEEDFHQVVKYEVEDFQHTVGQADDPVWEAWLWCRQRRVAVRWLPGGAWWAKQAQMVLDYEAARRRGELPEQRAG